jgi:hypothetical protein
MPEGNSMSKFLTRLQMEASDDKDDGMWRIMSPFRYQSDVAGITFSVPAGFTSDLASVPRLPVVYLLTGGRASEAAVIHDWIYTHKMVPRRIADGVLREASAVTGVSWWVRNLMWAGVRAFGWSHWK